MAVPVVSGTYNFNPTLTQLITQSYRDLDIIDSGETPTGAQFEEGAFLLNSIVKGLEATGIHVWTEQEAILFFQPGQARYTLGSSGVNDNAPDAASWTQGSLVSSYIAGTEALSVTPGNISVGINIGDNIGVVLDAGQTFWTTVQTSAPGANGAINVTTAAPLPSSASSGNVVLDYAPAAEIVRPLKVPAMRLFTYASQLETPMTVLARQGYMDLPNKTSQGVPTQFFYTPQRDLGWVYIWPVPVMSNWAGRFTWYRPLQDFTVPSNNMDFPQEWAAPLRWMLSDELKLGYSVPQARAQMITAKAADWLATVSGWDRDSEPVQMGMDWQYR